MMGNDIVDVNNMNIYSYVDLRSASMNSASIVNCSCYNISCVNACIMYLTCQTGSFINCWFDPCVILSSSILNSLITNCCITDDKCEYE